MNDFNLHVNDKHHIVLSGMVHFDNVMLIKRAGTVAIDRLQEIYIDLSTLAQSDSSGLALLSSWVRRARSQNKKVNILNMPRFLSDMARVCGMDVVFPVNVS